MVQNAGDSIIAPGQAAIQVFTSSGTWNKPNGVRAVRVRIIGAGGGSGGVTSGSGVAVSGAGGGGGSSEQYILAASLGSTETVTIGAAGTAGTAAGPGTGGTGGTTSFGAHCTASGGLGGTGATPSTGVTVNPGGGGGAGSGGDVNLSGGGGGNGHTVASSAALFTALGGATPLGMPAPANHAGLAYGGGGGGNSSTNTAGFAGSAGVCIVESIF